MSKTDIVDYLPEEMIIYKIKAIKIAFCYRSFYRFINRILIMCKIVYIEKQSA